MINKTPIELYHEELYLFACSLCLKYDVHIKEVAFNYKQTVIGEYLNKHDPYDKAEITHILSNDRLNEEIDHDYGTA